MSPLDPAALAMTLERIALALEKIASAAGTRAPERDDDADTVRIAGAARIAGMSVKAFGRLLEHDPDLGETFYRPSAKGHRRFSKRAIEKWRKSRT